MPEEAAINLPSEQTFKDTDSSTQHRSGKEIPQDSITFQTTELRFLGIY